jgi:hypothetical protein
VSWPSPVSPSVNNYLAFIEDDHTMLLLLQGLEALALGSVLALTSL